MQTAGITQETHTLMFRLPPGLGVRLGGAACAWHRGPWVALPAPQKQNQKL